MKKARGLSTICTSLFLAAPGVVLADLPLDRCFVRDYDAAHLAAHPGQGVAGLRLWFFDETDENFRAHSVLIEARMSAQGQAARDGVAGQVLTQYAFCDGDTCFVECDGGSFTVQPAAAGGVRLATQFFVLGEAESCGGISDLAEQQGSETVYLVPEAPIAACEVLWRTYPLPAAGCYGIEYSDMGRGQGLLGIRLRLEAASTGRPFTLADGTLAVNLPNGGRAQAAGMGGARVQLPVWCASRDGRCRSGMEEGSLALTPDGQGVVLTTSRFLVFGPEEQNLDIAMPGQSETRHALRLLPDDQCRGME